VPTEKVEKIEDAKTLDILTAGPLMAVTLMIGLNWNLLLNYINPAVQNLLAMVTRGF